MNKMTSICNMSIFWYFCIHSIFVNFRRWYILGRLAKYNILFCTFNNVIHQNCALIWYSVIFYVKPLNIWQYSFVDQISCASLLWISPFCIHDLVKMCANITYGIFSEEKNGLGIRFWRGGPEGCTQKAKFWHQIWNSHCERWKRGKDAKIL